MLLGGIIASAVVRVVSNLDVDVDVCCFKTLRQCLALNSRIC